MKQFMLFSIIALLGVIGWQYYNTRREERLLNSIINDDIYWMAKDKSTIDSLSRELDFCRRMGWQVRPDGAMGVSEIIMPEILSATYPNIPIPISVTNGVTLKGSVYALTSGESPVLRIKSDTLLHIPHY